MSSKSSMSSKPSLLELRFLMSVHIFIICKICTAYILKVNGQQDDFSTIVESWQNTLLENINSIADFSSRTMRSSTTTFLANQNAIFKEAVKKRLRPLLPDDGVFENMFASMKLDIDCLNPNNPPVVDNDLTSGLNGILIKVIT